MVHGTDKKIKWIFFALMISIKLHLEKKERKTEIKEKEKE